MNPPPLRVLIAAEHASTRFGGEAILPFHYFRLLRQRGVDAWLIVHERTRDELQQLFPDDHDRLRFVEDTLLQKLVFRLGRPLPRRIAEATFGLANHLLTQRAQRPILRSLTHARTVVHQPIPVSPRFPSCLSKLAAPLVIGPLNGGMEYPPAFRNAESSLSRIAIALGRSFTNVANTLLPGKKHAAAVLVANERTRAALPSGLLGRVHLLSENGVDLAQWSNTDPVPSATPRFLFIGRLVDWKALDIVLEALRTIPNAHLDIIGDGPMRNAWQHQATALGVADRVIFHGWLPQSDCAPLLHESCALVLPSIYECGGAVVLEAMASARPVIATAWGGPADYLDETCGILVAPTSREALVHGFAAAMQRLAHSPEECNRMGQDARARVEQHFDWERKIDAMLEVFETVSASH